MDLINEEVLLDSPTGAYYSGQTVNGKVVFELVHVTQIRAVHINAKGFCKVSWTTSHTRREHDRTIHYTVPHESYEEYINLSQYLIGNKNAEITLHPGKYEYPFTFQLSDSCPSTFVGSRGYVRYQVVAFIDFLHKTVELNRDFDVHAPLDLNQYPCREPVSFDFDQSFCCWCVSSGAAETVVKIPVRGYCPGQVIPIEVFSQNRSGVTIDTIRFTIKKKLKYRAINEPDEESESETVDEMKKGPVPPHTDRKWSLEMPVPEIDIYNLNTCSFIDLDYVFKVSVEPDGCHSNDDDSCELILGTIPIVGFQDNVANPLQDQLPQVPIPGQNLPPAVITQPVSAYPTNTPYPSAQPAPYPTPNPYTPSPNPQPNVTPYPAAQLPPSIAHFPPNNTPYPPPNNTPYPPPNNTPYPPPSNTPYPPPNNTPYPPPNNTPYPPPNNTPYPPPNNTPYPPPNNTPYPPPNNTPYPPPNNTPYPPPNNTPYPPPNNAPYPIPNNPPYATSTLQKAGDVGFTKDHDSATVPLLPPANSPRLGSPYAGASAPACVPGSPTTENPKLLDGDEIQENPAEHISSPYNPAFMNTVAKEEDKKE